MGAMNIYTSRCLKISLYWPGSDSDISYLYDSDGVHRLVTRTMCSACACASFYRLLLGTGREREREREREKLRERLRVRD